MAKVSDLPAAAGIAGDEQVLLVQEGEARNASVLDILAAPGADQAIKVGDRALAEAVITEDERGQVALLPVPIVGYEARLSGIVGAIVDAEDRLIERQSANGPATEYGHRRYAGQLEVLGRLSINGISEDFDWSYEGRLVGGVSALIDESSRIVAYLADPVSVQQSVHALSAQVAQAGADLLATAGETLGGFEARLIGGRVGAVLGTGDRVIAWLDDPTKPDALPPLAARVTVVETTLAASTDVKVDSYEARLLGRAGALIDPNDSVIAWFENPNRALSQPTAPVEQTSTDIAIFGDSISAPGSGIGPTLAALFPGRISFVNGIGGQRTGQIARRQSGTATTGAVAGDSVPASGAVAVTGLTLLNGSGNSSVRATIYAVNGAPIEGTLTFTAVDGTYAFTRMVAEGASSAVPSPAVIEITSGMGNAFVPMSRLRAATQVWVTGRNDVGKVDYAPASVMLDVGNMQRAVSTHRFVIVGVKNGKVDKMAADGGTSYLTTPAASRIRFEQVAQINNAYRAVYPSNFLDIMTYFEAAGLTEPYTVDGKTFQVVKAEVDSDGLHPNDLVGKPFMAGAARDFIQAKGW